MCGIVGLLNTDGAPINQDLLSAMTLSVRHRGPDDEGIWIDGSIGLGHRRLSIIDLTPAGHCPMLDHDKRACIVFNGEVYNYLELLPDLIARGYSFHSVCDTEVVLNSYLEHGAACLKQFNGMWGFAIWDLQQQLLFCARDRFGVKPFYYAWDGKRFRFSSEIKSILADPGFERHPNNVRLSDFVFNSLVDHTAETMYEGIYQLPPAHYLIMDHNGLKVARYWQLEPSAEIPPTSDEQISCFSGLLTDAIRLRLRSDVPVGTCLSGGLDSSSIVCIADRLLQNGEGSSLGSCQQTFSACFDDPTIDERPYIRAVLEKTKAESHEVYPTSADIAENLDRILLSQDEPFNSPSPMAQWFVMKRAREANITVMLDGQGGDEILAGYDPHWLPYLRDLLTEREWSGFLWEIVHDHRMFSLSTLQRPLSEAMPDWLYPSIWRSARPRFFPGIQCWHNSVPQRFRIATPKFQGSGAALNTTLYRDVQGVRLPVLLHFEDRNSMAHSIEARTPFLDYRLVEYTFGLSLAQKRWRGTTKVILREALRHVLPGKVLNRKDKIGFATPKSLLLDSPLREMIRETIYSPTFAQRPYFNIREVKTAWQEFQSGRPGLERVVWLWFILEKWLQAFNISV